jgi:hypothetical protein
MDLSELKHKVKIRNFLLCRFLKKTSKSGIESNRQRSNSMFVLSSSSSSSSSSNQLVSYDYFCRFTNVCAQKPGALAKEVALMLWICDQGIPFSAFDRPTWKNFESFCNIKLSGSSTLVQHRLPPVFAEMQKNQDVLLDKASSVVPILDGWETAHGGKIIGMIYSFLTDMSGR